MAPESRIIGGKNARIIGGKISIYSVIQKIISYHFRSQEIVTKKYQKIGADINNPNQTAVARSTTQLFQQNAVSLVVEPLLT